MRIRAKLMLLLVFLGATAVLVTAWTGYVYARDGITARVLDQLTSVREAERSEIESYFQAISQETRALSEGLLSAEAMKDFAVAVRKLDQGPVPATMRQQLEQHYQKDYLPALSRLMPLRSRPEDYLPDSRAPFVLQHRYFAKLSDPVTTDAYGLAHEKYDRLYRGMVQRFAFADLYLIDADSGRIVYSTQKRADLGTSLIDGPYRKTKFAAIFELCRKTKDVEGVHLADFEEYEPSFGAPAAFACSPVYEGDRVEGVFAVQLSIAAIDNAISGNRGWEREGLGKTGESRLVGADFLMRSNARQFIENPKAFLDELRSNGYPEKTIDKIRTYGTTVLQLEVRLPSVEAALAGKSGTVFQTGVTGTKTLVSYAPLRVPGLKWSVGTKIDEAEALAPVVEMRSRLTLVTIVVLLGLALAASIVSRRMVIPIQALAAASEKIAAGDLTAHVTENRRDEIGTLSHSFNQMAESIRLKTEEIERKNRENESLLLNILPSPIADRLKGGESSIADQFAEVTVLFADIVNFTALAQGRPAAETVDLLNDLFCRFDEAAAKAGVEKIKTIGDAYMAVAGLPYPCEDHVRRMADLALAITEAVRQFSIDRKIDVRMRIGLNTGPVVAGVIGTSKFIYDLWGDTVNIASRMESHGLPGCIQVTRPIVEKLGDDYVFLDRGEIEIKGKGLVNVWLMHGLRVRERAAAV